MKKHCFRPLRFWQKTYLVTLALFLVCLAGGVFAIMTVSRNISFRARREAFLSRQHIVAQSLAVDIAAVSARRSSALDDLFLYYGVQQRGNGLQISIWQEGDCRYSSQSILPQLEGVRPGQRRWEVRLVRQEHWLYATTAFTGDLKGYAFSACASVEDFYQEWRRTGILFGVMAGGVSLLFAVGLYLAMRQMNTPMQALTKTAQRLAEGDFSARSSGSHRTDELGELGRTLDHMAEQVEDQMRELSAEAEAKQRLVDNLSHEMRTPLTAIGGYADYIRLAPLDGEEVLNAADTIGFESRRLLGLSDQLLKLSVLQHEPLEREPLDPAELIQRAAQTIQVKAAERGVKIEQRCHRAVPMLCGQPDLLESLLVNLADNAVKASEPGQRVIFGAEPWQNGCRLWVQDEGRGMDEETLHRLGQPFYRPDKARSRAEGGAGLGVSLCKAIAAAHGATLHYSSISGEGTTSMVDFAGS